MEMGGNSIVSLMNLGRLLCRIRVFFVMLVHNLLVVWFFNVVFCMCDTCQSVAATLHNLHVHVVVSKKEIIYREQLNNHLNG